MAHTVTITHGSTTITLSLVDYTPSSAPADQETVTERWEVFVEGSTLDLLVAAIHAINRAFELARQQQKDSFLDRVYLNFQPKDLTDSQRSQIVDGRVEYYDETLKWGWANKGFDVRLVITRKNYWEGDLTMIPLSNSNGTDVTTGLNVYNCNDGDGSTPNVRENYADIDGADIEGDLPAPVKLSITAGATAFQNLLLVLCNADDPTDLIHTAECEDGVGTTGADATCSDGYYGYYTWSFEDTEEDAFVFPISASGWHNLIVGLWYLPVLRLRSILSIADLWTRVKISAGLATTTQWIKLPDSSGPQIIQYPPIQLVVPRIQNPIGSIYVQFKTPTSGSKTVYGDYFYLLPLGNARKYDVYLDTGSPSDELVDDPYENVVYRQKNVTGSGRYESVLAKGNPLMLDPQRTTRIYFQHTGVDGTLVPITVTATLKAWYRPRRLAL